MTTTPPTPASGHHTPATTNPTSDGATVTGPSGRGDAANRMARSRYFATFPDWDQLLPSAQDAVEEEARQWIRAAYRTGVTIVPPGRTVVDLPEPTEVTDTGASWTAGTDDTEFVVITNPNGSTPTITVDDMDVTVADLRATCLAGLAACQYADLHTPAENTAEGTAENTADGGPA